MNINEGYQPNKKIKNPKPPGPENERVTASFGGFEFSPPPPPAPPPPRLYNGFGVRIDRPPTTEYHGTKHRRENMEPMSVLSFTGFIFCAFCLGVGVGSIL